MRAEIFCFGICFFRLRVIARVAEHLGQQGSGVALEDEHGVVHVLIVSAVEKTELLPAVGGIVGGIEVKQDL